MSDIKMVITDLDGTLLQADHTISPGDQYTLNRLGELGICRVAATGRNLYKVRLALTEQSPFDYVICSSGAGIVDWRTQELIRSVAIPMHHTRELIAYLIAGGYNFKVSHELPDNHHFGYWESSPCPELTRYVEYHQKMGEAEIIDPQNPFMASQFLMFFPKESNQFELVKLKIQAEFPELSIIKTTSPLSDNYIWMEIFPNEVSKAHGIQEICRIESIKQEQTLSIGNDFNDMEMLEYTQHSYVVENAPEELKKKYRRSLPHYEDGFSHAVKQHLTLR